MIKGCTIILLVICVCILFVGCTDGAAEETISNANAKVSASAAIAPNEQIIMTPTATQDTSRGTLGDFSVSILDYDLLEDYKSNPAIRIYYELTNNSSETVEFMVTIKCKAFQNGAELETAFVMDRVEEDDNALKDIETGATLVCTGIYALNDESPVLVEATGYFSLDDSEKLTKTFNIAEGN